MNIVSPFCSFTSAFLRFARDNGFRSITRVMGNFSPPFDSGKHFSSLHGALSPSEVELIASCEQDILCFCYHAWEEVSSAEYSHLAHCLASLFTRTRSGLQDVSLPETNEEFCCQKLDKILPSRTPGRTKRTRRTRSSLLSQVTAGVKTCMFGLVHQKSVTPPSCS